LNDRKAEPLLVGGGGTNPKEKETRKKLKGQRDKLVCRWSKSVFKEGGERKFREGRGNVGILTRGERGFLATIRQSRRTFERIALLVEII